MTERPIFLGIDCGATTSKVCGVDGEGHILSREMRQRPTQSEAGPEAVLQGWMDGLEDFLAGIERDWSSVSGVGLAIPGPYLGYGVLGPMPNMPKSLTGWRFLDELKTAVRTKSGRSIPVTTANDGALAGLAEARFLQRQSPGSVLMFAPGSGLGCSFVSADGKVLLGDHGAAAIFSHMPAPYAELGLPAFQCGCGRSWGCFEAYTAISGLPQLVQHLRATFPQHPLCRKLHLDKADVLPLRAMAQTGDSLALKVFEIQARALGLAVSAACMAYDPTHVVIGGGVMDKETTTSAFRQQYLETVRIAATPHCWGDIEAIHFYEASLGELSQAVGAALYAKMQSN